MTFGVSDRDPGQLGFCPRAVTPSSWKTVPVNNSEGKAPRGFARSPWRQITESEDVHGLLGSLDVSGSSVRFSGTAASSPVDSLRFEEGEPEEWESCSC